MTDTESITAKICAFARAWHSGKTGENKIADDYLAFNLMGQQEYIEMYRFIQSLFPEKKMDTEEKADQIIATYFAPIPLARMHFTERRLEQFAEENGSVQYVICGAGEDTFSLRCRDPRIEIFEIDHPNTQRHKLERMDDLNWTIPENVNFVPIDFETERMQDKLLQAGFQPLQPAFFSILGVSYYLTLPVFIKTLEQIARLSARGSMLVFDYPKRTDSFPERVSRLEQITHSLGETMQGGFDYKDISKALYTLGFQIDTYFNPEQVQQEYFQNRTDGLRAFENVSLLSATYTGGWEVGI
ncbi:MAG: class I SAM-dependent methyltransferase [Clostridia bacterium]|nr:class I SAM-dependent methyltransferase [Clostridia bacterium]